MVVADFCPKVLACPRRRCESCTCVKYTIFSSINVRRHHLRRLGQTVACNDQTRFEAVHCCSYYRHGFLFWLCSKLSWGFRSIFESGIFWKPWMCGCTLMHLQKKEQGGKGTMSICIAESTFPPQSARYSAIQVPATCLGRGQDAHPPWLVRFMPCMKEDTGLLRLCYIDTVLVSIKYSLI